MGRIVIASNNNHKISEFREIYSGDEVLSLRDIGFTDEIIEDGLTFEDNSLIKARAVYSFIKKKGIEASVIADDSGLCVNSLNGAPGVFSARYSGDHDDKKNRDKLLKELKDKEDRSAYFCCALAKIKPNGEEILAIGKTYGFITKEEVGDTSFGYDCLFFSNELNKTFGEATKEEKNSVSHRGRAVKALVKLGNEL